MKLGNENSYRYQITLMTDEQFKELQQLARAAAIAIQLRQKNAGDRSYLERLAKEMTEAED